MATKILHIDIIPSGKSFIYIYVYIYVYIYIYIYISIIKKNAIMTPVTLQNLFFSSQKFDHLAQLFVFDL